MLLNGKVAIVTGAGSGMGRAISLKFAEEGARVAVVDLNYDAACETQRIIGETQSIAIRTDVSNDQDVKKMVEEVLQTFGQIDIVVNSAGIPQVFTAIEELTIESWSRILDVNLKSIFLTSKYVVPHMKERKQGTMINIASIAGIRARPGLNAYCASKGGAIMLTKALAIELAPYQIRVNAINPGPADTPMLGRFISEKDEEVEQEKKDIFIDSVPLGSLIQSDDIANAALFLASDQSRMVTGEILNVDGGRGI